jgi:hypothetical protein
MIADEVKSTAAKRIRRGVDRLDKALAFLEDADLWKDFNPNLVSVGNLILHLIGNVSQHVLSGLGGQSYTRHRDREFTDKPALSKADLIARLHDTVDAAARVLDGMDRERLEKTYGIQGMSYTGAGDVLAVMEHFSYHVGQIVFAVKLKKNVSLGLSNDASLNR